MSSTELLVCWIDPDYDREQASDGQSRYGAYVRDHARLFDPWQDAPDGVTRDPVDFAIAAFRVATGPIMGPGFVRWHPRVCGYRWSAATMVRAAWWCRSPWRPRRRCGC